MSNEEKIEESREAGKTESQEEKPTVNRQSSTEDPSTETESEISNRPTEEVGPKSEITNMEVHHHPHVEKKSFKEYLLEGIMIFIAVTMGFIAESIRENITKHEKEHHLMEMLVQDLKKDIIQLDTIQNRSKIKLAYLDTLRQFVFAEIDNELSDSACKKMYYIDARFGNSGLAYRFVPIDRALSQLEKTDAYNFISRQNVSDSILNYKGNNTTLIDDYQIIREYYQIKAHEVSQQIFKSSLVDNLIAGTTKIYEGILQSNKKFTLLTRDKNVLEIYGSKLRDNRLFFGYYTNTLIPAQQARAERLITLIENEYHLKKE